MSKTVARSFGQDLKALRLNAGIGLRDFADLIGMKPSNLSNIERDRIPPPAKRQTIDQICDALGLGKADPARGRLFDLAAKGKGRIPADVADAVRKRAGIPVLVRTVANKQLSKDKIKELTEYINEFY